MWNKDKKVILDPLFLSLPVLSSMRSRRVRSNCKATGISPAARRTFCNWYVSRTSWGRELMILPYDVEGVNNRNNQNRTSEESHEPHRDFDDSANDLWSLYGKEAVIHDQARIKTLKDDMDGILIFVCAYFSNSLIDWVDVSHSGWRILRYSRSFRRAKDSGLASKPCKSVGLLPESICSDA